MVMGFPWPRRLKRLAARPGKVALRRPGRKGADLLCPYAAIIGFFQNITDRRGMKKNRPRPGYTRLKTAVSYWDIVLKSEN